jgi:hypothetical protein
MTAIGMLGRFGDARLEKGGWRSWAGWLNLPACVCVGWGGGGTSKCSSADCSTMPE